jgi:hypothetical protein
MIKKEIQGEGHERQIQEAIYWVLVELEAADTTEAFIALGIISLRQKS